MDKKTASEKKRQKSRMIQTNGHWVYELACIAGEMRKGLRERKRGIEREMKKYQRARIHVCVCAARARVCVCVCVRVCHNEKKVSDEWQARVCVCVCVSVCVCVCLCVSVCTLVCVCVYVSLCLYRCLCLCVEERKGKK